ncbi:hypothetical protein EMCG_07254 [[Emmonsia] crescens]|uniref:Uncharacterized protein n=1 Tax=[Emmonsia] crescens TaxID=73230 RepID=A0A0G2I981_9EURO|nr:hypothetical protein EMCG_07254 [Emmonsia crescens UAMH 3008]
MSIVALSIANYLNIPTHATINAGNPENELVQDLQEQTESQSPCIGHHTPIFESLRPDELNMPNANGSGFRQESMTNIDSSFVWSATMPPGDHELGSSPPYFFPNRVLQPFPYDSQLMEPLSWNAEQPQDLSQGRNTLHSALGSFSYMSQGSWMEPIYPALYSSAESVKYKENANGNISQMSFVPDSCPRTIDTDNHSTSLGQTTRVAYSHAIVTDGGHFTPRQVRNGCSSVSLKPRETCGKKSSRRKVFRHSLSSSSSRSASSKKKPQFREAKRPFVEYMFHASSGEPAVAGSNKRRRTKDEKQETARIRELGGACEPCRRQHRKCALKHHQDSPSTKNITS